MMIVVLSRLFLLAVMAFALPAGDARAEPELDSAVAAVAREQAAAGAAQAEVTTADAERMALLAEVEALRRREHTARVQVQALNREVEAAAAARASLEAQLAGVEDTRRELTPLMLRMVEALGRLSAREPAYRGAAIRARAEALEASLVQPDLSLGDRWRGLVDAYTEAIDAGHELAAGQAEIALPAGPRTVDVLRIGRLALLYRSLDGTEAGYWDREAQAWRAWPGGAYPVRVGLQVARKQRAPELLAVPVPAPNARPGAGDAGAVDGPGEAR